MRPISARESQVSTTRPTITTEANSIVGNTHVGLDPDLLDREGRHAADHHRRHEHEQNGIEEPAARPAVADDERDDQRRERQPGRGRRRDAREEVLHPARPVAASISVLKRARRKAQQVANSIAMRPADPAYIVQRPQIGQDRGRHAEAQEVRETVELGAELAGQVEHPGRAAVQTVQDDGGARAAPPRARTAVQSVADRGHPGAQAEDGEHVGHEVHQPRRRQPHPAATLSQHHQLGAPLTPGLVAAQIGQDGLARHRALADQDQGLDPVRQVDVAAAAEPDQADPLAGRQLGPLADERRRCAAPRAPRSGPARLAAVTRRDREGLALVLVGRLVEGGVEELAGMTGQPDDPARHRRPVHMDIEHVHEDADAGQRGCPQAQLRRRDARGGRHHHAVGGAHHQRGSSGVTRAGSRKKYAHHAVARRPSQNSGCQNQPSTSDIAKNAAMNGQPARWIGASTEPKVPACAMMCRYRLQSR